MNVPGRLASFAAVTALAFGGAALAGAAIDPTDDPPSTGGHDEAPAQRQGAAPQASAHGGAPHGAKEQPAAPAADAAAPATTAATPAADDVGGLAVSAGGYALRLDRTTFAADRTTSLRFRIVGRDGRAVRDGFRLEHEKRLHLIVVRRDTKAFLHVHPRMAADGTWSVDVRLPEAGVYRAFADFNVGGDKRTLAADLFVPGAFRPAPLPAPARVDGAVEVDGTPVPGLQVALKAPRVRAGRDATLTFAATQDGRPVERLEPYLGAAGHLVALREGDLGYLHVHPMEADASHAHGDGEERSAAHPNETAFAATFPTPGRYRLFLQVKTDGRVRTVDYTVEVPR